VALVYCTKCRHYPVGDSAPKCPKCGAPRPAPTASQPRSIQTRSSTWSAFSNDREIHGYAQVCGILAIALAIAGCIIPVVGVLFITPIAIVANAVALHGGYRRVALATAVVVLVNLMVSPTFWLNVAAGAMGPDFNPNRVLSYFDAVGVVAMLSLIAWPRRV
jgi:hypothetical protein